MKKVVIIGGGFAGAYTARALEKEFEVTLVDTKDYFEFTPSVLRAIVEPLILGKIQIRHTDYLKKATFIREDVSDITEKYVLVGKKKLYFDYAIIATGSSYSLPIKESDVVLVTRGEHLQKYHAWVEKMKRILIIGGGLVGVELAAELCTHYPTKEITIVHSGRELLERNERKTREYAQRFLEKRGVKIIFGELANEQKKNTFITDKGTILSTDVVFPCTGIKPNYGIIKKHFSSAVVERRGIAVNEFLQMKDARNIFAVGDVTAIAEEKTAQTAETHAWTVVENIRRLEKNKTMLAYKATKRPMVISLGKWDGILEYKGYRLTGFIPALAKKAVEIKTMIRYRFS